MYSMNTDDITHLASLSRLELSDEELASFPAQFESILAFVDQVKEAPVDEGVVRDMQNYNSFREDNAIDQHESRDAIIDAFPNREEDLLQVSKVLPN